MRTSLTSLLVLLLAAPTNAQQLSPLPGQPIDTTRQPPVMLNGSSLRPLFQQAVPTMATTVGRTSKIAVASTAGIAIGQQVFAPDFPGLFPSGTLVTAVSGNIVTLSQNATATHASQVPIQFGQSRWSPTSSFLTNTLGAERIYLGGAAKGNYSWLNRYVPGIDYGNLASLISIPNPGDAGVSGYFASRTSDNNGAFSAALNFNINTVVDSYPAATRDSWGLYNEANLLSKTVGYHMNEESSVYSLWPYVPTDPYAYNPLGGTRNTRLDCGKGPGGPKPKPCSAALEIIQNDAQYGKGIVFGHDAVLPFADKTQPVVVMATNQALHWFRGTDTPAWAIVSVKTSGAPHTLTLGDSAATASVGADIATGGHFFAATGAPTLSACGTSPSLNNGASDVSGTITEGESATGCTVTFLKPYAFEPVCVVSSPSGGQITSYSTSTTALTIVHPRGSGNRYSYICMGG